MFMLHGKYLYYFITLILISIVILIFTKLKIESDQPVRANLEFNRSIETNIIQIMPPYAVEKEDEPQPVYEKEVQKKIEVEICQNKLKTVKPKFEEDYDAKVIRRHPNIPLFLTSGESHSSFIPEITSIRWTGIVYQESWIESPKFLLYSAHFDARLQSGLIIRIIALYDGQSITELPTLYCQMWFSKDDNPVIVPVNSIEKIRTYRSKKPLYSASISCKVPSFPNSTSTPIAVSLVKQKCQKPYNILKIFGEPLKKKTQSGDTTQRKNLNVGICSKALFYYNKDFSIRLIEWIEIIKLLGVSKIFLYLTTCHENVKKVLEYYEKEEFVSLVSFYFPPPYVQEGTFVRFWTKTKKKEYDEIEAIYLNDCILRNKDQFDYLGVFDCDEVPILRKQNTLQDFLQSIVEIKNKKNIGDYYLKWKHFYANLEPGPSVKNITNNFYILQHNRRKKLTSKEAPVFATNGKSIYDTNKVLWIHPHYALSFLPGTGKKMTKKTVAISEAYTAHFGYHECRPEHCNVNEVEEENLLLKFHKIVPTVEEVAHFLGIT